MTALEVSSSDPISTYKYAYFLHRVLGEFDEAEKYYIKSHELHPSVGNMISYSSFLVERGEFDKANRMYSETIIQFKDNAISYFQYAKFLHTIVKRDYDKAGELYKKALEINPEDPELLKSYAEFLLKIQGDNKKSEELLNTHRQLLKESNNHIIVSDRLKNI